MEALFSSIEYKDPIWITIAFIFGLLARWIKLPALVGFLAAGFLLNYLGADSGFFLNEMANLGVTLLLFIIGLKLRVKDLLQAEVWGVTLLHTLLISCLCTLTLLLIKQVQIPLFAELDLQSALIFGFALSFSSTVFVVKLLERRGDLLTHYGRLAIGVLIVQDIFAVLFMGIADAKLPSVWAAVLISIIFLGRPFLFKLFTKTGHGELQILFGLVVALGGAALFEAVDMKADLGALIFGALLANHSKAQELVKALSGIKELFLVGFFLSIGLAGLPNQAVLVAVLILLFVLLLKTSFFFVLFTLFKVRSGPATIAAIGLGSFSEFGLIVSSLAVSRQLLSPEWLVVMAVLVAFSFVISSASNNHADDFYSHFSHLLEKFQRNKRLLGDEDLDLSDIHILVCGMGRVGSGAYDHLIYKGEKNVLALDSDQRIIQRQLENGRDAKIADVSSADFWSRFDISHSDLEWILLCTSNVYANSVTASLARQNGFKGLISATTHYPDEEEMLKKSGVNAVFNIYAEAGVGLAQHSEEIINNIHSDSNADFDPLVCSYKSPFNE